MIINGLVLVLTALAPIIVCAQNLGPNVNTEGDEYINQVFPDSIVFTRRSGNEFVFTSKIADGQYMPAKELNISWYQSNGLGAASLTGDGKRMYFVGIGYPEGLGRGDIYYSDNADNQWRGFNNLGKPVNSGTMESQPFISADGKELYFVRDTKSNKSNIYCSRYLQGGWSDPKPMASVNTRFGEMSPFVNAKGTILYFASEGHGSHGGYDVFMCRRLPDGDWGEPENLGAPVNSEKNEISFRLSADGKKCYVSSDRDGGKGGFDIYVFDFDEPDVPMPVDTTRFVMRNIRFEFDSAVLLESSYRAVDSLAYYLKENPSINIEISGFTDDSGTAEHNQKLSQDRANSVKEALINKGVDAARMTTEGYGSNNPIKPNDTEENKALNRRVEIRIL